jgi:hypothetical protein
MRCISEFKRPEDLLSLRNVEGHYGCEAVNAVFERLSSTINAFVACTPAMTAVLGVDLCVCAEVLVALV